MEAAIERGEAIDCRNIRIELQGASGLPLPASFYKSIFVMPWAS